MAKTAGYNLTKPEPSEHYDINVQNSNMDIIDTALTSANNTITNHVNAANPHTQYATVVDLAALQGQVDAHRADTMYYSTQKLSIDSDGIYTEVQHKRADGTLILKSVLSGGTPPNYTTRTETKYATNGTTVECTKMYTISYDANGNVAGEVLT